MADTDKAEKTVAVHIPVAKRHQILADVEAQLKGLMIEDLFEVAGHMYELTVLTIEEETWSDSFSSVGSPVAAFSSIRAPRLAAAIKSIDGVKVADLFQLPSDMPEADQKYHSESPERMRMWQMQQMLIWLSKQPGPFITDLWRKYVELNDRRSQVWDEVKKSSAGTHGGDSKASSSPAKGS